MTPVSVMLRKRIRCEQCRAIVHELKAAQLQLRRTSLQHKLSLPERVRELRKWQDVRDEVGRRLQAHKESHLKDRRDRRLAI